VSRRSVAWSSDGRLVAWSNLDGSVQALAIPTGEEVAKVDGKQGGVWSLAFSPDGGLLASGGANGTILVWEMPERQALQTALSDTQREGLWGDLADADAGRAYRALCALADAPEPAVALIKDRWKPQPAPPDRKHLGELVANLDSDEFTRREKASQELAEAGLFAEDLLRRALEKKASPEILNRVRELLKRIALGRLRGVRAVEVLERIGTPAAKELLAVMGKRVNDPLLEQEIAESLDRLGRHR
jgi:hypothetical protein